MLGKRLLIRYLSVSASGLASSARSGVMTRRSWAILTLVVPARLVSRAWSSPDK